MRGQSCSGSSLFKKASILGTAETYKDFTGYLPNESHGCKCPWMAPVKWGSEKTVTKPTVTILEISVCINLVWRPRLWCCLGHAVPWCMLGWLYTKRMAYLSPEEAWLCSRALTTHLRASPVDTGLVKMPCFDRHEVRRVLCVHSTLFSAAAGSWVEKGFCARGMGVCRHFSCP